MALNRASEGAPPPLLDSELARLRGLGDQERAEWMVEEVLRRGEAWGLADGESWVVFGLEDCPPERRPWALPLWPRMELAALGARAAGERPVRVGLDELLGELLPELEGRGWQVQSFPQEGTGVLEQAGRFARFLEEAREEWDEDS